MYYLLCTPGSLLYPYCTCAQQIVLQSKQAHFFSIPFRSLQCNVLWKYETVQISKYLNFCINCAKVYLSALLIYQGNLKQCKYQLMLNFSLSIFFSFLIILPLNARVPNLSMASSPIPLNASISFSYLSILLLNTILSSLHLHSFPLYWFYLLT